MGGSPLSCRCHSAPGGGRPAVLGPWTLGREGGWGQGKSGRGEAGFLLRPHPEIPSHLWTVPRVPAQMEGGGADLQWWTL